MRHGNRPFEEFARTHFISESGEIAKLDGSPAARRVVEKRKLSEIRFKVKTVKRQLSSTKKAAIRDLKAKGRTKEVMGMWERVDKLQARLDSLKKAEKKSAKLVTELGGE